jgi:molybdopterin-guanine dinucleotide biosynthesis protein A
LSAALRFARDNGAARVLTIPCDMPRLPADLGARLHAALDAAPQALAAVAASGGRLHPVCALWKVDALRRVASYAATGRSSLKGFAEACGSVRVAWDADEHDPFVNANTPDELAALQPEFGF